MRKPAILILAFVATGCNPNAPKPFYPPPNRANQLDLSRSQQPGVAEQAPPPGAGPIGQEPPPSPYPNITPQMNAPRLENFTHDQARGAPVGKKSVHFPQPQSPENRVEGTAGVTRGQTREAQRQAGEVGKNKELNIQSDQLKWGTAAGENWDHKN